MEGRILPTLWGYPRLPAGGWQDTAKASMLRSKDTRQITSRGLCSCLAFLGLQIVNKDRSLHKSGPIHQDFQAPIKDQKMITDIPSHCLSVLSGYSEKEIMNSVCERAVWENVEENIYQQFWFSESVCVSGTYIFINISRGSDGNVCGAQL